MTEHTALEGEEASESQRPEPVLAVEESLTPLPEVDRALPVLVLVGQVTGRRRARFKVAVLKTLQADGSGRWKIRRLQEVVHWLEPTSVTDLVGELKEAGVLRYDPVTHWYRLSHAGRVVAAVLDALTVPSVEPRVLIRFLNKAMALALAAGAGEDAVLGQFASAVAVLRSDWEELVALIDDRSETALLEAAELVRAHTDDMRELLDEHETFFVSHRDDPHFLHLEQEALDLVAKLGRLAAEVVDALTGRATDRLRRGLVVDRSDIREFLTTTDEPGVAALVAGLAGPAPGVRRIDAGIAFDALAECMGRTRPIPPPLPEPEVLAREAPRHVPDPAQQMAEELRALVGPLSAADLVVRESWATSVRRHSALVGAYSQHAGLPPVSHTLDVRDVFRDGVWRMSETLIGVQPDEEASSMTPQQEVTP